MFVLVDDVAGYVGDHLSSVDDALHTFINMGERCCMSLPPAFGTDSI